MTAIGVPSLLLLSDVDGTLLGDDGALPAPLHELRAGIERVRAMWPGTFFIGLASSRTLRELTVLQRALALPGPCIAEDSARCAIDAFQGVRDAAHPTPVVETHGRRRLLTWSHARTGDVLRAPTVVRCSPGRRRRG